MTFPISNYFQNFASSVASAIDTTRQALSTCFNSIQEHPYAAAGISLMGIAITNVIAKGKKLYTFTRQTSIDQGVDVLLKDPSNRKSLHVQTQEFVEVIWPSLKLPDICNTDKNKQFLAKKLFTIFLDHGKQTSELKKEIVQTVIANFCAFISNSVNRIETDLAKDKTFQKMFNFNGTEQIKSLEMLADETHNYGKGPLLITLANGKKIVYKPRSMICEEWICGTQQDSLFRAAHLGTYLVYNKPKENYGYCDFLENKQEQNTIQTKQELQTYMQKFDLMDKLMTELNVSDLHRDNVVTQNKTPYLVDLEVIALPIQEVYETGLLTDFEAGCIFSSETKNQIWFDANSADESIRKADRKLKKIKARHNNSFYEMDCMQLFIKLGVIKNYIENVRPQAKKINLSKQVKNKVEQIKGILHKRYHRFIFISTSQLIHMLKDDLVSAKTDFQTHLTRSSQIWNFKLDESKLPLILEKFEEDLKNNDIPVFYYHPLQKRLYYHDIAFARQQV